MGIPDHLTCLLRNLYAGQEATVRTRYEQWTGSKLGKKIRWNGMKSQQGSFGLKLELLLQDELKGLSPRLL